jgi:hypothetical protein
MKLVVLLRNQGNLSQYLQWVVKALYAYNNLT